jgi:predicted acylesterase/phospholipase RssA
VTVEASLDRVPGVRGPPYLIRTYPVPSGEVKPSPSGHQWSVIDASLATTATPGLFPPHSISSDGQEYTFQDPGLSGSSNPAGLAREEAARLFPSRRLNVLLSMGCGLASLIHEEDQSQAFDLANHLVTVSSDAERQHEELAKMFRRL